jgi:predicted permease
MDGLTREFRGAWRSLKRGAASSASVIVSTGLAIGAATTAFAWMENLVRNPFPAVPGGGSLVVLNPAGPDGAVRGMPPVSYPTYLDWRPRMSSFTDVAAHTYFRAGLRLDTGERGIPVWAQLVSPNYFDVLELSASRGRLFSSHDEAEREPVLVMSHALWHRRFGGGPGVIGSRVSVNGVPLTVIGVTPPRFGGVVAGLGFDAWLPVWLQPRVLPGPDWTSSRGIERMQAFARLRPGVESRQARHEVASVAREVSRAAGESPARSAAVRPVGETQFGSLMGPLSTAMLAVAAVVLFAACANTAGLLVARGADRERQFALQLALGAGRWRVTRERLIENGALGLLGGALGIAVAWWAKDVLPWFAPRVPLPVRMDIELRIPVLAFAAISTMLAAALFGAAPAVRASRSDLLTVMRSGAGVARRAWLRHMLVTGQIALALVAVATAGLFLQSVRAISSTPLGFGDPAQVLLVSTDFGLAQLAEERRLAFADLYLERVRALPGVRAAGFSTMVPLGFGGHRTAATRVEGYTPAPDESTAVEHVAVSTGYFDAMQIPIVKGRGIAGEDRRGSGTAVVVNEAFAARYWPGLDPLGRRVDQGAGWATVVGVAKNSVTRDFGEAAYPVVYAAFAQVAPPAATLHVRTAQHPRTLVEPLRREAARLEPDLPLLDPGTLSEHIAAGSFVQHVGTWFLGAFGALALVICAGGIHAVLVQQVVRRRRDLAIRIALGASPRQVASVVLGSAAWMTVAGVIIGVLSMTGVSRIARALLVGVGPSDQTALAGTAALLLAVALGSTVGPAVTAIRTDPVRLLRGE